MAEEKPFFDIPQQLEKNQIESYLKRILPKDPIDEDIYQINYELNSKKKN